MIERPTKLHITGPVGSGKTYLAEHLSKELDIPHFQLDNFVWTKTNVDDIRNSDEVRDKLLQDSIMKASWIIEGAQNKWVDKSFERADIIIYLLPSLIKRDYLIIKRFFKQKIGLEKENYRQNLKTLMQLFKWSHEHDSNMILKKLEQYRGKVLVLNDSKEIENYIKVWTYK